MLSLRSLAVAALCCAASGALAQQPVWWASQANGQVASDYSAATVGQAKNIAAAALDELAAHTARFLPRTDVPAFNWRFNVTANASDFTMLNVGQLKSLSGPFLNRLQTQGSPFPATSGFPWAANATGNYAATNLGQVKNCFAYSFFGVPKNPAVHPVMTEVLATGSPDKLEIANFTGQAIPGAMMAEYYISDDPDFRDDRDLTTGSAVALPSAALAAGARTVINLVNPYPSLANEGDYLGLFYRHPDGTFEVVQEFLPHLPTEASGTLTSFVLNDAPGTPGYLSEWRFNTPAIPTTFGAANGAGDASSVRWLQPPTLQVTQGGDAKLARASRGFFSSASPITVKLRHPLENDPTVNIRYTTNHNWPTPGNSLIFPANGLVLSTTTTIKAIITYPTDAPNAGRVRSEPVSFTFIAVDTVADQAKPASYPSVLSAGNPIAIDYAMDPNLATNGAKAAERPNVVTALRGEFTRGDGSAASVPSIFVSLPLADLTDPDDVPYFTLSAADKANSALFEDISYAWDPVNGERSRPIRVSFEWYDPARPSGALTSEARMEATGDSTAYWDSTKKKSWKLRFGVADDQGLYCDFFGDGKPTYLCAIALKNPGHDSWTLNQAYWGSSFAQDAGYVSDQMVAETIREMGEDLPSADRVNQGRTRLCHLYINGLYWGLYVLNERPDASRMATFYNEEVHRFTSVDDSDFNPDQPASYNPSNLHIGQYSDYYMTGNFLGCNGDWPGNNIRRSGPKDPNSGHLWHFYGWGMEYETMELGHLFDSLTQGGPGGQPYGDNHTNPVFKSVFRDRLVAHCAAGGALSKARLLSRYNRLVETFGLVALSESARWGDTGNPVGDPAYGPISTDPVRAQRLNTVISETRTFLDQRPTRAFDLFKTDLGLPDPNPF